MPPKASFDLRPSACGFIIHLQESNMVKKAIQAVKHMGSCLEEAPVLLVLRWNLQLGSV